MRGRLLWLASVLAVGCGSGRSGRSEEPSGPVDLRTQVPPPSPSGRQFLSGEYVIQPGEERQLCVIETYEGPDVGVRGLSTYQGEFGHHVAFLATAVSAQDYPDGEPFNCTTDQDFPMTQQVPLFLGTAVGLDGTNAVMLPEGMATLLRNGTRILVQSHYVNTGSETIRVQDGFNVELVNPEQVQTWVAPFVNAHVGFAVPAGEEKTVEFDCTFGKDVNLLYLYGHMHDWGSRFHIDLMPAGGTAVRVYDVESWDPSFRDEAPINSYDQGEFPVAGDEVITTSCTWMNDTAGTLSLPQEMCVSLGMAYPAQDALMCIVAE